MIAEQSERRFDVLTIGPSFVDLFIKISDEDLVALGLVKAHSRNISCDEFNNIMNKFKPYASAGGGMATNTAVNMSKLGAKVAWIYKLADDELGRETVRDLTDVGIFYNTAFAKSDEGTGSCIIFSTPDGERTMCPYYGAQKDFSEDDIDEQLIKDSKMLYIAGCAINDDATKKAIEKAYRLARKHGTITVLNSFDVNTILKDRDFFDYILNNNLIDIFFGNYEEFSTYFGENDEENLFKKMAALPYMSVVTRSEKGATAVKGDMRVDAPSVNLAKVVDTTGAGDAFVAGYLYAMSRSKTVPECAKKGNQVAAAAISVVGARPVIPDSLKTFD